MHIVPLAFIAVALCASPVGAQTQPSQPNLSDDQKKPQQNSADEAGIKGRLEDGVKPGDAGTQGKANKKLEDAAVKAKRKSDANPHGK